MSYLGTYCCTAKKTPASAVALSVACALPHLCVSTSRLPKKFHIGYCGNTSSKTCLSKHVTLLSEYTGTLLMQSFEYFSLKLVNALKIMYVYASY
jgi:hypothetical protein